MLERMTSSALTKAIDEFGDPRGYLAVASIGLPPRAAVDALSADLNALWRCPIIMSRPKGRRMGSHTWPTNRRARS